MAGGRRMRAAGVLALSMALAAKAWGGSFVVNPIRVNLSAAQRVSSLIVRNDGVEPVVIQFDAVAWSQEGGKDVYTMTKDVLATPPIFTVPAGGTQTIRVGLRRAQDARHELAYRLFLQELPAPAKPGFAGAQMALRLGVPLFVRPETESGIAAAWRVQRTAAGKLKVGLHNEGASHLQILTLDVRPEGGTPRQRHVAEYVLPGQARSWEIDTKADGDVVVGKKVRLLAQSDAGALESEVLVEPD